VTTGYEQSYYRSVERIEQHLHSIESSLRAMAGAADRATAALERLARAMEDPPIEDPPDTSWIETETVRPDYGRDPKWAHEADNDQFSKEE
jgi:pyrrolidone-carboxylate peptidase